MSRRAWTDDSGAMHLRIAKSGQDWTCAEVSSTRSLGYGTYQFVVRHTSHLEPAAVFGMFTWDYASAEQNNREMDIEIGSCGWPGGVTPENTGCNSKVVLKDSGAGGFGLTTQIVIYVIATT